MGNEIKQRSLYNGNFKQKEWQVKIPARDRLAGNPSVVRTTDKSLSADEYIIQVREDFNVQRQRVIYQQRASSMTGSLVNVFSVQLLEAEKEMPGSNSLRVRTQRIPWRLSESSNLEIYEGLYILDGAIAGYYELAMHAKQPFIVTAQMIGLNSFGRVKVWLNSNYALNQLEEHEFKVADMRSMLEELILVVQFYVKSQAFPQNIRNSLFLAGDFMAVLDVIDCLLTVAREQKVQIGKKMVDTSLLKEKINENRNDSPVSSPLRKKTQHSYKNPNFFSNSAFKVAQFEKKAIQYAQTHRTNPQQHRSHIDLQEHFINKLGDSNAYSPQSFINFQNLRSPNSPLKKPQGFFSAPQSRLPPAIELPNKPQNEFYKKTHFEGKKSAVLSQDRIVRSKNSIVKSEIFRGDVNTNAGNLIATLQQARHNEKNSGKNSNNGKVPERRQQQPPNIYRAEQNYSENKRQKSNSQFFTESTRPAIAQPATPTLQPKRNPQLFNTYSNSRRNPQSLGSSNHTQNNSVSFESSSPPYYPPQQGSTEMNLQRGWKESEFTKTVHVQDEKPGNIPSLRKAHSLQLDQPNFNQRQSEVVQKQSGSNLYKNAQHPNIERNQPLSPHVKEFKRVPNGGYQMMSNLKPINNEVPFNTHGRLGNMKRTYSNLVDSKSGFVFQNGNLA